MRHVKITTKTYKDNTGKSIDLPTLLVEHDGKVQIIEQLLKYQLKYHIRSRSWHNKLVQIVGLLFDYMEANQSHYNSAKDFFETFTEAVYSGTISEEGLDPSGLYWLPKRTETANVLLSQLSIFSDWLHEEYGAVQLNPWRKANKYEERLNWMAQINKSHRSFLGHLDDIHEMTEVAEKARNVVKRRKPYSSHGETKAFPENQINNLLWKGFKKTKKNTELDLVDSYNWRDIAITILMHGGGLRHSEAFHLWTQDVFPDPQDPNLAVVRVYHPSEGKAPEDFKTLDGRCVKDRESYLLLKYGLKPRNMYVGTDKRFAGWKNPRLDDNTDKYMNVYWFSKEWGYLFMRVWKMYMYQRLRENIPETHPFAFVSHSKNYKGEMLPLRIHRESHSKAVKKIGLVVGKNYGTTPHGHRHAFGRRLSNAGLNSNIIRIVLHHKSEESQKVYTEPTIFNVTEQLNKATTALDSGLKLPINTKIDAYLYDYLNEENKSKIRYIRRKINGKV